MNKEFWHAFGSGEIIILGLIFPVFFLFAVPPPFLEGVHCISSPKLHFGEGSFPGGGRALFGRGRANQQPIPSPETPIDFYWTRRLNVGYQPRVHHMVGAYCTYCLHFSLCVLMYYVHMERHWKNVQMPLWKPNFRTKINKKTSPSQRIASLLPIRSHRFFSRIVFVARRHLMVLWRVFWGSIGPVSDYVRLRVTTEIQQKFWEKWVGAKSAMWWEQHDSVAKQ